MSYGAKHYGDSRDYAVTDQQILALWCAGRDTFDIARATGVPESAVSGRLPRILAIRRLARAFGGPTVSHETKEPFRLRAVPTA